MLTVNKKEIKRLKNIDIRNALQEDYDALDSAIRAAKLINHLTDRPCEVCEFHKENGCSRWNCVFEEVNADE